MPQEGRTPGGRWRHEVTGCPSSSHTTPDKKSKASGITLQFYALAS